MADYFSRETRWASLKIGLAAYLILFLLLLYGPTLVMTILSFQAPNAGPTFPIHEWELSVVQTLI